MRFRKGDLVKNINYDKQNFRKGDIYEIRELKDSRNRYVGKLVSTYRTDKDRESIGSTWWELHYGNENCFELLYRKEDK